MLAFDGLTKLYGDRTILSGVDGLLEYGEKIMLVGGNGAGKSTLFKLLLGQEAADQGKLEHGSRLDIGYLAQTDTGYWQEDSAGIFPRGSWARRRGCQRASGHITVLRCRSLQVGKSTVRRGVD